MSAKKERPISKTAGWRELPSGGMIPAGGTAEAFKTGDWRTIRPVHHREHCIDCMQCWAYCPDMAILLEDGVRVIGMDFDHCKGCGICANVCPTKPKSIDMVSEIEAQRKDAEGEGEE